MNAPNKVGPGHLDAALWPILASFSLATLAPAALAQAQEPSAPPPQATPKPDEAAPKPVETEQKPKEESEAWVKARAASEAHFPTPNYSGDFWTRSTMTGDWWDARNALAKSGVTRSDIDEIAS